MKRLRLTLLLLMLLMMMTACASSGNSMEALSVTAAPQEDEIPRGWRRCGSDRHIRPHLVSLWRRANAGGGAADGFAIAE